MMNEDFIINENTIFEDAKYDDTHQYPIYIVLMHSGTPLANAIKKVTGDEYSHACISFNAQLNPLYSFGGKTREGEKGFGFVVQDPKDKFYKNHKAHYSVYVMFVSKEGRDAMKQRLHYFQKNKNKMKYDTIGLVQIFFGQSTDYKDTRYFCSRFVMDLISQGADIGKKASLWKPEDIKQLQNISLLQTGDDFYKYSRTKANQALEAIKKISNVSESVIACKYANKYLDAHPVYKKFITINNGENNCIGEYTPRSESDYCKVNAMLEFCNMMCKNDGYKITSKYYPTTIGSTGLIYINNGE